MNLPKIFIISTHPPGYPSGGAVSLKYRFEKLSSFFELYMLYRVRTDKGTPANYLKKSFPFIRTPRKKFFLFIYTYIFKIPYIIYKTVISEKIKIIQIEHVKNLVYSLFLFPLKIFFGVRIYYTAHDLFAEYYPEKSVRYKITKFLELFFFNFFIDKIFVWGKDDQKVLLKWGLGPKKVAILPIVMPPKQDVWVKNENMEYVFIGTLGHKPNEEALDFILQRIWPIITQKNPDAKLHLLLGKDAHTIKVDMKNVINYGYVDNIDEIMHKANISLAPIFSGVGIKTKIAESFAFGIPVITTELGLLNFDNLDRSKILIAHTPEEYLEIIEAIDRDKINLNEISQYERNYCENMLSDSVIKQYIQEYCV